MTTRNVAGTPAFLDPLYLGTLQQSELTDGFAAGITLLMALVGLPATGLDNQCRHMLRHPTRPEKWQAPGVPDATAGEWPDAVATALAEVCAGLTERFADDRMPLPDALQQLEAIVEAADEPEPPPTRPAADVTDGGGEEPRECMMCLDAPRELRFGCGHACCCRGCFDGLVADAVRKGDEGARCPVCREAVVEASALARLDAAPTFVMQPRRAAAAPAAPLPAARAALEGARGGGRSARGRGRGGGRRGGRGA